MARIDNAKDVFEEIRTFAQQHSDKISSGSEADTRIQLIDRILIEVLGWNRDGIFTEPHTDSGYIDYLISSGGRNILVIEAKKSNLSLINMKSNSFGYYKVGSPVLRDAEDGISQAVRYCSEKSVPFAVLSNGLSWVGFRPQRLDGVPYRDGVAAVFPDLDTVSKRFAEFYELFSQEGVLSRLYNIYLDREEGSALSSADPFISAIPFSEIYLLKKTDLARDLEQVFNEFFRTITGDSDPDLLLHCFVETTESREADRSLEKITRDIVNYIQEIRSNTVNELKKEIEASHESKRGQIILIVGNKGAGKSTFIERFFKIILDRRTREKCLVLRINVAKATGSVNGLQEWLTDRLIETAESELYGGRPPDSDELRGIFFDHYQRWSTGEHKHLYDTDPDAFKIRFEDFIADRRQRKPFEYLSSILKRAVRQRSIVPCIVFDNADNHPALFQDAVFQYAYSLHQEVLSVVVVPITDRTIWRLSKAGALQSYSAKTFYLPVPSTKDVLEKRVLFIKRKLEDGVDKGKQYFTSRGLRISMENMPAFAACVEEAFIRTDFVSRRVGWLTNYDLRRSLELSQKIITAPILKVDDLVAAYFAKRSISITEMRVTQSLLYGDYNKFRQDSHEYVLNLFSIEVGCLNSPLLRMSILRLLKDKENAASDAAGAHMSFEEIDHYFEAMRVATRQTLSAVRELVKYRLAEPYEPNIEEITPTTKIAITFSGHMHLEMALNDMVYIEQMAQTTPIRSESTLRNIRGIISKRSGQTEWDKIRKAFSEYCIHEDKLLMNIPLHPSYSSQDALRRDFLSRWKGFEASSGRSTPMSSLPPIHRRPLRS